MSLQQDKLEGTAYILADELRSLHGNVHNDEMRAWELFSEPLLDNQSEWMFLLSDAIDEKFDDRSQMARVKFADYLINRMVNDYEITD